MTSEIMNKTVSLTAIKNEKQKQADSETLSLVKKTLNTIKEEIESFPDTTGLLTIIYDRNKDPKIMWGGDMDYVKMLGSLDLAKMEISAALISRHAVEDID